jgi:chloride channel protein, CIC family
VFALELTHDLNATLPLLVACSFAYGLTVLLLKRSILTEKVARRGFHLSREYAVDPLEILFVREVMSTNLVAFPASQTVSELAGALRTDHSSRGQHLYPVIDPDRRLVGVLAREDIGRLTSANPADTPLRDVARKQVAVAHPGEPLRVIVYRMAETGFTRLPVLDPSDGSKLVGMVGLEDLLRARARNLTEERHRERVLRIRLPFGFRKASAV